MKLKVLMIVVVLAAISLLTGILYAANGDLIVNGNLGVGTTTPAGKAEINGNMIVDGNLGVGTSTPSQKLSVAGNIQSTMGGIMFPDGSTQTTAAQFPAGVVTMYGGSAPPGGWLLCNGSAVSRATYANLFAAIGTTYGVGDGSTTFILPDLRGVFPKGAGSQAIGSITYTGTLGTKSNDRLQGHMHASGWYGPRGAAGTASVFATNASTYPSVNTGNPLTDGVNGTPRIGATTEPQSLSVNFIIKY